LLCSEDVPTLFPDSDPSGTQFASREHNHPHEAPHPTPVALPSEQAQGLQRSELSQQPHLQPLPQQAINAGYNQYGQPVYQTQPNYGAMPAAYVPSQQPIPQPQTSQPQRTSFKPSWFPFSKK
jgi:hypothetical protein